MALASAMPVILMGREDAGLLAQVFDLDVELGSAVLQTRDQEV